MGSITKSKVRVRFAPSPTGALHLGGLRTALYNYLFARKHHGSFILRIEDTDRNRLVDGAERYISEALSWLGISPDEGPIVGGPHAPYRQSERADIYRQYAEELIVKGKAYYAFDTSEELEAMRLRLQEAKVSHQQYNSITRMSMRNALTMAEDEVRELLEGGAPYVVRLKVPVKEDIRFRDQVRGWIKVQSSNLDDKIILKSGGMPTYHLANVVDDHLMGITHVIRGEEWLPSAPLHVLLYRFLGWEREMPEFAHLPLILRPDGKGKLSKRDAEQGGFPLFPLNWRDPGSNKVSEGFREVGFLPAAMINFLAMLGWNPGNENEIFSLEELVENFSLSRIVKSGARFDYQKALWYNQHYVRQLPDSQLSEMLQKTLNREGVAYTDEQLKGAVELLKDRITFAEDIWRQGEVLFREPSHYDELVIRKKWSTEVGEFLQEFLTEIEALPNFEAEALHRVFVKNLEKKSWSFGKVMPVLRVALTGAAKGPDLMKLMSILGPQEIRSRLHTAMDQFEGIEHSRNG